jgi:hypothetical protein
MFNATRLVGAGVGRDQILTVIAGRRPSHLPACRRNRVTELHVASHDRTPLPNRTALKLEQIKASIIPDERVEQLLPVIYGLER